MEDKAKDIFLQGYRFRNAGLELGTKAMTEMNLYGTPFIVNMAFAMELYLKCIYQLENKNKKIPNLHELDKLFNVLSDDTKDFASKVFTVINEDLQTYKDIKDQIPDFEWTLSNVLLEGSRAFIQWRYSYEGGRLPNFLSVKAMVIALESTIFWLREDLSYVHNDMHKQLAK